MKKKMIALLAGALLTLAASNAMAAFVNGDLIRVVYNHAGTVEVATDLGSISSLLAGGAVTADTFSLSQITGATSAADLYVSYYASNFSGVASTSTAYLGAAAAPTLGSYTNFNTPVSNTIVMGYNPLSTSPTMTTVLGQQSNVNSYFTQLTKGGAAYGVMGSSVIAGSGEQNLSTLLASGGNTTIYSFTGLTGRNQVTGTASNLVLATNYNATTGIGSTSIVASTPPVSATPIPAAAYLLGSGLLGLVGIRRKQK